MQSEKDRVERYSQPLLNLSDDDLDAIDRRRHEVTARSPARSAAARTPNNRFQAIRERLEHNGYHLPGASLYPGKPCRLSRASLRSRAAAGTKYPLTGAPVFKDLPSGHPLLQPESRPTLLSAVPELRNAQLLQDAAWLGESEHKWTTGLTKAEAASVEKTKVLEQVLHEQAVEDQVLAEKIMAERVAAP